MYPYLVKVVVVLLKISNSGFIGTFFTCINVYYTIYISVKDIFIVLIMLVYI